MMLLLQSEISYDDQNVMYCHLLELYLPLSSCCCNSVFPSKEAKYKTFTQKPTNVPLAKQYVMVCRRSGNKIPSVANQSTRDRQIINFLVQSPYPLATGWQAELAQQPMWAKEKSLLLLQITHSHAHCRQSFLQDCYPAVHNSDVMQTKKISCWKAVDKIKIVYWNIEKYCQLYWMYKKYKD